MAKVPAVQPGAEPRCVLYTHRVQSGWSRDSSWDDAPWRDSPPDPLDAAELYEGVRLRRLLAYAIDFLIIGAGLIALWLVGSVLTVITFGALAPAFAVASVLLPLAYHTWFLGSPGNATLGMRALDLRLVAWNGRSPGFAQAALQTVAFYLSVPTTSYLILLIGLFNDRGRCLHDLLCGTVVVNDLGLERLREAV